MIDKERNTKQAVVIGKSGDKSLKVAIDYKSKHPVYSKYVRRRSVLKVHDEHNSAKIGDTVEITSCRRYSKTKSWRLMRVLESSAV